MTARPLGALAVAALLVTAGCSGFAPGGEQSPSFTPAPVPDDPADYPPGVTAEGVVVPERLARAHVEALENVSYRLHSNRSTYYTNGSVRSRIDLDLQLSRDRSHRVDVRTAGPAGPVILGRPPATAVYWSNRTLYASRISRDGDTAYSVLDASASPFATWNYWAGTAAFGGEANHPADRYTGFFRDVPTTVVGTRTVDGTTVYRLRGRRAQTAAFAVGPVDAVGPAGPGPALRANVTSTGLVRSLHLRYRAYRNGEEYVVDWRIRYRQVGNVTVQEPPWLDRAISSNR